MSTSPVAVSWATAGTRPWASHLSSPRSTLTPRASRARRARPGSVSPRRWCACQVEHGCDEDGVGLALDHPPAEIIERSHATRGDDGHGDRLGNRARQLEIVAIARAVSIHAGEEDLPRSQLLDLPHPCQGIPACGAATAMRVDAPPQGIGRFALGVDGDDDALAAEALRC